MIFATGSCNGVVTLCCSVISQRFVHVRHEQLLLQEFDLRLEFCFDDVELEACLQQPEQILDVVHPTGDRFQQKDIFWTHELDHEISRVEIAFASLVFRALAPRLASREMLRQGFEPWSLP